MTISQFGYLGLGVKNMEAWEEYASEVLGLEVSERAPDGTVYLRMDEYHHRIALLPNGADDLAYVGWQCLNRREFDDTKAALLKGGVEYSEARPKELAHRRVRDMVKFDVAGIPMEVFFGPTALFEKPFKPGRPITGFKTGDLGLGHIGLAPSDPKDASRVEQVLRECLGFKISDVAPDGSERFFHCNGREHTAVVSGQPSEKRIGHFMLELKSIDDVGMALDLCEDKGVPLTRRLGRHTNDHMISFYMRSPSGFGVEYGWGGRLVDDSTWSVMRYDKFGMWGHRAPVTGAQQQGRTR